MGGAIPLSCRLHNKPVPVAGEGRGLWRRGRGLGVAWAWPGRGQACTGPGKMAAMDTESAPLTLESLPTDPLLLILSFLDYRDLIK